MYFWCPILCGRLWAISLHFVGVSLVFCDGALKQNGLIFLGFGSPLVFSFECTNPKPLVRPRTHPGSHSALPGGKNNTRQQTGFAAEKSQNLVWFLKILKIEPIELFKRPSNLKNSYHRTRQSGLLSKKTRNPPSTPRGHNLSLLHEMFCLSFFYPLKSSQKTTAPDTSPSLGQAGLLRLSPFSSLWCRHALSHQREGMDGSALQTHLPRQMKRSWSWESFVVQAVASGGLFLTKLQKPLRSCWWCPQMFKVFHSPPDSHHLTPSPLPPVGSMSPWVAVAAAERSLGSMPRPNRATGQPGGTNARWGPPLGNTP